MFRLNHYTHQIVWQFLLIAATVSIAESKAPINSVSSLSINPNDSAPALLFPSINFEFVGHITLPKIYVYQGTEVGGLSGIDYDTTDNLYYVISDHRGDRNGPPRFYSLSLNFNIDSLELNKHYERKDFVFHSMTTLLDKNSRAIQKNIVDPESIRLTNGNNASDQQQILWVSEGDPRYDILPSINVSDIKGRLLRSISMQEFLKTSSSHGINDNLGLESLALSEKWPIIYTATENALLQDGKRASVQQGSLSRIIKLDLNQPNTQQHFIYQTEAVPNAPKSSSGAADNGLVELLPLNSSHLLALERAYSEGVGNSVKLFVTQYKDATNIAPLTSIHAHESPSFMQKKLVFDVNSLPIKVDNIEGMTWGPKISQTERLLILVSDNNFRDSQVTQFIALKVSTH